MWTRRRLLTILFWLFSGGVAFSVTSLRKGCSTSWAKARTILHKGFPKNQLIHMNPAEVDGGHLDVDPLHQFGTMGATDVTIDTKTYRLRIKGEVKREMEVSYDGLLNGPSVTEDVLLICPGFFAYKGRWTGVQLRALLQEAQAREQARYVTIKGHGKDVRIALKEIEQRRIVLAYRVNGEPLPRQHGFPLRLVFEDAFGYDWIKYVDEIIVSS